MRFIVDHCVPRRYVRLLQTWGYEAEPSIRHLPGDAADTEVLALAQSLRAVLLTVDLDFANVLVYPPANTQGIVVLRYQTEDEVALDQTLQTALQDLGPAIAGCLIVVAPGRYRVRR